MNSMLGDAVRTFLRWFRLTLTTRSTLLLILLFASSVATFLLQPDSLTGSSSKSIFIVGLLNFNLLLLVILVFVLGRNLLKMFFARNNKAAGHKLRQRLVLAFLSLTLIPTLIMFLFASGLVTKATSGWFNAQVSSLFDNAIFISQQYLEKQKQQLDAEVDQIATTLENSHNINQNTESLKGLIEDLRNKYGLSSIIIYRLDAEHNYTEFIKGTSILNDIEGLSEPDPQNLEQAAENKVYLESLENRQFLRAYRQINFIEEVGYLVISERIDPEITASLSSIEEDFRSYGQLEVFKSPLKYGYLLTLAIITCVILFAAIWLGLYLAREISAPLSRIASATKKVARGDYSVEIAPTGDDELTALTQSFNTMVKDLRTSQTELDERRKYTETILDNLNVGVIGFDPDNHIFTVNKAAAKIFNWQNLPGILEKNLQQIFASEGLQALLKLLENVLSDQNAHQVINDKVVVNVEGESKEIVVTGGQVVDKNSKNLGRVILFDDVTALNHAQKIAAWREVARRLAHEIKNPLTPIKLSAQRIIKNSDSLKQDQLVKTAETIVNNTDVIKVLIDEFAKFARLPVTELSICQLNDLVTQVLADYQSPSRAAEISFSPQANLPLVAIDSIQFRRCVTNLIDNALAAVSDVENPRVQITTSYDQGRMITLEVADNGSGIDTADRAQIFDPYFTKKKEGSGLGLAIVANIIADHQGTIKVFDNQPSGSRFIIELPADAAKNVRYGAS